MATPRRQAVNKRTAPSRFPSDGCATAFVETDGGVCGVVNAAGWRAGRAGNAE